MTSQLTQKAIRSGLALGGRQIVVQGANVLGGVLLARLLTPAQFGVYAIVTFLMTFLITFSGTGLAANLIRQSMEPTNKDYRAIFSFQTALVLLICSVVWIVSPILTNAYQLPKTEVWIFPLVSLAFLASSFMVIPQVKLERKLQFNKLVPVEMAMAVLFNGSAVFLAWIGWGAFAFAVALVLRYLLGAVLLNVLEPWSIGLLWRFDLVRKHLRFGFQYQGAQLISAIKDSINPLFVGLLLGASDVGYINWANMVANYPVLMLIALQRLYMPLFAQLQADRARLASLVEQTVWATNAITVPVALLTLMFIKPVTLSVFGGKWLVAIPIFYLLWLANIIVPTITPLMGFMNAIGRSRFTLNMTLIWAVSTWVFSAPLIMLYGVIGFAIANVFVQFTNALVLYSVKKEISISFVKAILPSWMVGVVVFGCFYAVSRLWAVPNLPDVLGISGAGLLIYFLCLLFGYREKFRFFFRSIRMA